MKDFFARLAGWFTESRRAAVQGLITGTLTLLVVLGAVSTEQSAAVGDLAASGLIALQGVIGLALLRSGEWYTWFNTTGRAVIYGLATALGPVGIAFQLWGDDTAAQIVTVSTVVASLLTALVQIVNTQTVPDPGPPVTVVPLSDELKARLRAALADRRAEIAAAEQPIEANPATYETEREPEAVW